MKKIEAIIRPMRLEPVKAALAEDTCVSGLTVSDVRGVGSSPQQQSSMLRGQEYVYALPAKIKIEMTVADDEVDRIIEVILKHARTGEEGDGKIFVFPMDEAVRIRTGDRGDSAVS